MTRFNLIIIGDEILHGNRQDKHFAFFKNLLEQYGFKLNAVHYLPDEHPLLVEMLKRSFSDGLPTFVTGGIGATPDDHTRLAAADALGVKLIRHSEAEKLINEVTLSHGETLDSATHHQRVLMADFPQGAKIIPNSYNKIAGFSICGHYFLPGFPVMAHPMAEWVLNTYYSAFFHQVKSEQKSIWVFNLPESKITPLMKIIEKNYTGIRTFSLPSVSSKTEDGKNIDPHIEFGIKAEDDACANIDDAWQKALIELKQLGGRLQSIQ